MNERHLDAMQQTDAFAWNMESDPVLRSTVVAVALLDRPPDWPRLREKVAGAIHLLPKFRHVVAATPLRVGPPRWVPVTDVDLDYHLRRIAVPAPGAWRAVLDYARTTGMVGFDHARPLWEFTVVEGLAGGRAAFVTKLHHALADGIGGLQIAMHLYDLGPDTPPAPDRAPVDEPAEEHRPGTLELVRVAVEEQAVGALRFVARAGRRLVPAAVGTALHPASHAVEAVATLRSVVKAVEPVTTTLSPLMRERSLAWHYETLDVPFPPLRAAAKRLGGSVNDAFLAGVTGGLRRYHERHGVCVPELRVTMPISVRRDGDGAGGNRITLARFTVPVGVGDPGDRLQRIARITRSRRREPSLLFTQAIAGGLNLLPRSYLGGVLKHVDFLASNVPGIRVPVYLAGARLERFYPFGPTIGSSVNITLMTYRDLCCLGVNTDAGAVPDPDLLLDCLRDGFAEVLALAPTGHAAADAPAHAPDRNGTDQKRHWAGAVGEAAAEALPGDPAASAKRGPSTMTSDGVTPVRGRATGGVAARAPCAATVVPHDRGGRRT